MPDLIITQDYLKKYILYCPKTGIFKKIGKYKKEGCCSCIQKRKYGTPYAQICFDYKRYHAHRMAWLYVHGYLPTYPYVIDHIDGNGLNNKINNLRCVHLKYNLRNKSMSSINTSGATGVAWVAHKNKWYAKIGVDGETIEIGFFNKKEDAISARLEAEMEYEYHDNHGRKVRRFLCD